MRGFTITPRETVLLAEVIETSRQPADQPLPVRVLELVKELLNADWVTFIGLDSAQPRIRFGQYVGPDGDYGCEAETISEAETNPFWHSYWDPDKGCSYADRTGDYTFVRRASDYQTLLERRDSWHANSPGGGEFHERLIQACLPAEAPGKYSRVTAFRHGSDFTEKDILFLKMLQPHFQSSFAASAATQCSARTLTARQIDVMGMV